MKSKAPAWCFFLWTAHILFHKILKRMSSQSYGGYDMKLEDVKKLLDMNMKVPALKVEGLAYDSREIRPGFIFFAINGMIHDGHDYIDHAVSQGAIMAICERKVETKASIPVYSVPNVKKALALISHHFFNKPSESLHMVGVTGTNGKTTVTHLIYYIYQALKIDCGLIGTNAYKVPVAEKVVNTTPMSLVLNKMLASTYENDVKNVIMEVSSHGIKESRIEHINFDIFIFTNLSPDHLDYHKNMDDYMWTKMRPFIALSAAKTAIVNIDNEYSSYLCDVTIAKTLTYGLQAAADFSARNIQQDIEFTEFDLYYKGRFLCRITTLYFGIYNVYNTLAAIAYFASVGYNPKDISILLKQAPAIDGRFDTFKTNSGVYVVVDYAHTPDAVANVLKSLSAVAKGDIISVLGAGGDRDRKKRPIMGKNALAYSKHVVFTSDNPRYEEPFSIIYDMLGGNVRQNYTLCIDREIAIEKALKMAKPGDVVIILGKGHEKTQSIKGKTTVFCDKTVAKYIIQKYEL